MKSSKKPTISIVISILAFLFSVSVGIYTIIRQKAEDISSKKEKTRCQVLTYDINPSVILGTQYIIRLPSPIRAKGRFDWRTEKIRGILNQIFNKKGASQAAP